MRWSISVVVPVFNAQDTLPTLIERLLPILHTHADVFEIILVNDGSRDASWATISRLAQTHDAIHGVDLMRNYGQHNALLAGVRAARHDIIVTLDDDLQHPPEEIPKLLAKLSDGAELVYGSTPTQPHGLWRGLASQLTKLALSRTMGADVSAHVSAFRAFRAEAREAFKDYAAPFVSLDVLLSWGCQRISAVPVQHAPRCVGTSQYTFGKLLMHALNMLTGYNVWPLRAASVLGLSCTLLGMVLLAYVLGRYVIEGGSVPGFAFLASVIIVFSGAQLIALGMIGEYLARMHFRSMGQPTYVIRAAWNPARHELGSPV